MGIFPGRHFPVTLFCGQWVVLPLRGELPRSGGNDDFSGACQSITPRSTAGSRNTPLSWTSKHGGTGRYLTGRPVPGGWMRPISASAADDATSIGRSPPVTRPWSFTSLRSRTWLQRSVSWPRPSNPMRQPGTPYLYHLRLAVSVFRSINFLAL